MPVKGYSFDPRKKARPYKVQIYVNSKRIYIGCYATVAEAVYNYRKARAAHPITHPKGGRHTAGIRYPRKRCKFCGEDFAEIQMNRHLRSCKWKEETKI